MSKSTFLSLFRQRMQTRKEREPSRDRGSSLVLKGPGNISQSADVTGVGGAFENMWYVFKSVDGIPEKSV